MIQNQNILPAHATPDTDPEAIRAAADQRIAGIAYRAKLNNGGEAGLNRTPGMRDQINEYAIQQAAAEGYDVSHLVAPAEPTPPTPPAAQTIPSPNTSKPVAAQPDVSGTALMPQMTAVAAGINVNRDKEPIFKGAPRHATEAGKNSWYRRSMHRAMGAAAVVGLTAGALFGIAGNLKGTEDVERVAAGHSRLDADNSAEQTSHEKASERTIDYLFDNPNKETPNAFGPEGDASSVEAALTDLKERYQKDPALVAAHAAANGFIGYEEVDAYTAKFASNFDAWDAMSSRLASNYKDMNFTIGAIPDGFTNSVWFADANKNGVPELRQSVTDLDGIALIGVDNQTGEQLVYRSDCGWQSREKSEINVPSLPAAAPEVTQTPSQSEAPNETTPATDNPEAPHKPEQPETPNQPEEPETPTTPEEPETPGEPEEPETPEEEGNEEKPRGGAIDDDEDMNEGADSGDHRTESGALKPATQPTNPVYDPVAAEQKQKENAEKLKKPVESIQENPADYEPAPVVNDGRSTVDMSDPTNAPGEQTDANGNVYTVDANGNVINNSEIQE